MGRIQPASGTRLCIATAVLMGLVACDGVHDPAGPDGHAGPLAPAGPLFAEVDPGAEVDTAIDVAEAPCGETAAVTVTLTGVQPPSTCSTR